MSNTRSYNHLFGSWADIAREYNADIGKEPRTVWAAYEYEDYSGSAVVVFKRDGKWFSNGGGHCSCYGLEGQWEPTPFSPAEYRKARAEGRNTLPTYNNAWDEQFAAWLKGRD